MKFKLDENIGARTQRIFEQAGHDIKTVFEESLSGTADEELFRICQAEQRCLVTLDLDFSNVLRFPPEQAGGIVVLRMPRNPSLAVLEQLVRQFLNAVSEMPVEKHLWIVELGRVRIHESRSDFEENAG